MPENLPENRSSINNKGMSVEESEYGRRGTITKLFGFILMTLGVLDSLLTLRGGVPAYEYLLLIFAGACVFAVGAIRGMRRPSAKEAEA
ncbi:MAG: hypothetical protein WAW10_08495 [Gallionella sp.]